MGFNSVMLYYMAVQVPARDFFNNVNSFAIYNNIFVYYTIHLLRTKREPPEGGPSCGATNSTNCVLH